MSQQILKQFLKQNQLKLEGDIIDLNECQQAFVLEGRRKYKIKCIKFNNNKEGEEYYEILSDLKKKKNQHIAQIHHLSQQENYKWVIYSYQYYQTNLEDFLKQNPKENPFYKQMSIGLLRGIIFLHNNGISHLNLKPSNILLDESYNIKICDLYYGQKVERAKDKLYLPPEQQQLQNSREITYETDYFSVGAILCDIYGGSYKNMFDKIQQGDFSVYQGKNSKEINKIFDMMLYCQTKRSKPIEILTFLRQQCNYKIRRKFNPLCIFPILILLLIVLFFGTQPLLLEINNKMISQETNQSINNLLKQCNLKEWFYYQLEEKQNDSKQDTLQRENQLINKENMDIYYKEIGNIDLVKLNDSQQGQSIENKTKNKQNQADINPQVNLDNLNFNQTLNEQDSEDQNQTVQQSNIQQDVSIQDEQQNEQEQEEQIFQNNVDPNSNEIFNLQDLEDLNQTIQQSNIQQNISIQDEKQNEQEQKEQIFQSNVDPNSNESYNLQDLEDTNQLIQQNDRFQRDPVQDQQQDKQNQVDQISEDNLDPTTNENQEERELEDKNLDTEEYIEKKGIQIEKQEQEDYSNQKYQYLKNNYLSIINECKEGEEVQQIINCARDYLKQKYTQIINKYEFINQLVVNQQQPSDLFIEDTIENYNLRVSNQLLNLISNDIKFFTQVEGNHNLNHLEQIDQKLNLMQRCLNEVKQKFRIYYEKCDLEGVVYDNLLICIKNKVTQKLEQLQQDYNHNINLEQIEIFSQFDYINKQISSQMKNHNYIPQVSEQNCNKPQNKSVVEITECLLKYLNLEIKSIEKWINHSQCTQSNLEITQYYLCLITQFFQGYLKKQFYSYDIDISLKDPLQIKPLTSQRMEQLTKEFLHYFYFYNQNHENNNKLQYILYNHMNIFVNFSESNQRQQQDNNFIINTLLEKSQIQYNDYPFLHNLCKKYQTKKNENPSNKETKKCLISYLNIIQLILKNEDLFEYNRCMENFINQLQFIQCQLSKYQKCKKNKDVKEGDIFNYSACQIKEFTQQKKKQ